MPRDLSVELRSQKNLWTAWSHVRESARHSQSDKTKEEVSQFARTAPAGIRSIYERLRRGSFQFTVPRAVAVERDGKSPRPIVVAPVDERIVQRGLLQVMQVTPVGALVEGAYSFGAVPGRSVRLAIVNVVEGIRLGAEYYARSDIGGFFRHIPRPKVIDRIRELLPDPSLVPILSAATEVDRDLLVGQNVATYRHLFPSPEVGMAQGGSLSAFFGNVAMEEFDALMNEGNIRTIRYVDDFVVLGGSLEAVADRFAAGEQHLNTMNMQVYPPQDAGSRKAAQGPTRQLFEFLGCEVSASFVRPAQESRQRLFAKIKGRLDSSLEDLREGNVGDGRSPYSSIARTLYDVNNTMRSWSASYSFCNADQILVSLDRRIDREIHRYLGEAGRIRKAYEEGASSRRVLGIFPLVDGKTDPIYGDGNSETARGKDA